MSASDKPAAATESGKPISPTLLTVFGLLLVALVVYEMMRFVTEKLGLEGAYWLVPLFGALGGLTGAVLRGDRKLSLCRYLSRSELELGVLSDITLGLGGATTVIFLFGGTLHFDPTKHETFVILISVSFIAGASGKRILELAVKKLEDIAAQKGKEAGEIAAQEKNKTLKEDLLSGTGGAIYYTQKALEKTSAGQPKEGLELAEKAISLDVRHINAYIEKGRALKRLGKLTEALATVEEASKMDSESPRALYNRACYKCLLKRPKAEVLGDLKQAFKFQPKLQEFAQKDADFESIRNDSEFTELFASSA